MKYFSKPIYIRFIFAVLIGLPGVFLTGNSIALDTSIINENEIHVVNLSRDKLEIDWIDNDRISVAGKVADKETFRLSINNKKVEGPWFLRINSVTGSVVNDYQYGKIYSTKLSEGLYSIYLKNVNEAKALTFSLVVLGENYGGAALAPRGTSPVRDYPLTNLESLTFSWFPQGFSNITSRYLFRVKKNGKVVYKTIRNSHSLAMDNDLLPDKPYLWSVVAYPEVLFIEESLEKLGEIISNDFDSVTNWIHVGDEEPGYLFGQSAPDEGLRVNLPLHYPSSIAFTERPDTFAISNGDRGEVIVVTADRYRRYKFKAANGMPSKISNLEYIGDNNFTFTDNRSHIINRFSIDSGDVEVISGKPGILYGQKQIEELAEVLSLKSVQVIPSLQSLPKNVQDEFNIQFEKKSKFNSDDALGLFYKMTSDSQQKLLVMSAGYKVQARSWYTIGLSSYIYTGVGDFSGGLTRVPELTSLCSKQGCSEVIPVDDLEAGWIVRTSKGISRVNKSGIVLWESPKKSKFDRGMILLDDGKSLISGMHTSITKFDTQSGELLNIVSSVPFANIVAIRHAPDGRVAVLDSDAFKLYLGKLDGHEFKVEETLGGGYSHYPNVSKVHQKGEDLYVLTSNPSYLFKYNTRTHDVTFIIGNGTNNYAVENRQGLNNSLYYPADFAIKNSQIYITEANHRVISIDENGHALTIFAGSIHNGKGTGKNVCSSALFTGLRGLIISNDSMILVDSGNDRVLKIRKNGNNCILEELGIYDEKGLVKLNYPTYIFASKKGYYLIDQNNNQVLQFDASGTVMQAIGKSQNRSYQGWGGYETAVQSGLALFNTPVSLAVSEDNIVYISDIFNGLIRCLDRGYINDVYISSEYMPNSAIWGVSLAIINNDIFIVDGLSKKTYQVPINKSTCGTTSVTIN